MFAMIIDEEAQRMMQAAAAVPMLTKREEVALITAIKDDGPDAEKAKARLIAAHQRQVIKIARSFAWCGKPLSELIQEGNLGIMATVRKYELGRGARFATFAAFDIREKMQLLALDRGEAMYIPPKAVKTIAKIKRLDVSDDVPRDDQGRAAKLGLDLDEFRRLRDAGQSVASLNARLGESESTELGDLIADTRVVLPDDLIADRQLRELLQQALADLSERERVVVIGRFGMDYDEEKTLEDLAQRFSVSRERIRQIERRALEKLAKGKYAKALRSLLVR